MTINVNSVAAAKGKYLATVSSGPLSEVTVVVRGGDVWVSVAASNDMSILSATTRLSPVQARELAQVLGEAAAAVDVNPAATA